MMHAFDESSNASTESLICTQYLSLPGRNSAPASPMSSTFFDVDLLSARSISPVPSNYALYTRSRPTSTASSILDFQSFFPIHSIPTPSQPQVALANTGLMGKTISDIQQLGEPSEPSSSMNDNSSLISKQTTKSTIAHRPEVIEHLTGGDAVPNTEERASTKKGTRRFLPKFLRLRAFSTSLSSTAPILGNISPSKFSPRPLAPSSLVNRDGAVAFDPSVNKGKGKAHSMFRFGHRKGASAPSSKGPTMISPPLRRSSSFADLRSIPYTTSFDAMVHSGIDGLEDLKELEDIIGADGITGLDVATLEALGLRR